MDILKSEQTFMQENANTVKRKFKERPSGQKTKNEQ